MFRDENLRMARHLKNHKRNSLGYYKPDHSTWRINRELTLTLKANGLLWKYDHRNARHGLAIGSHGLLRNKTCTTLYQSAPWSLPDRAPKDQLSDALFYFVLCWLPQLLANLQIVHLNGMMKRPVPNSLRVRKEVRPASFQLPKHTCPGRFGREIGNDSLSRADFTPAFNLKEILEGE